MPGLTKPITNFIDLADIGQSVQRAKAAEQQYQLRDLQMKDVMRKQQEQDQLRELGAKYSQDGSFNSEGFIGEYAKINPVGAMDMQGKNLDLKSKQAKLTGEQMKVVEASLMNPEAWGEGGVLHEMAPANLKKVFAGPFDEARAKKMHEAFLTAMQKEQIQHYRRSDETARIKAEKYGSVKIQKPPSGYRWGPEDAEGNLTLVPIVGGPADERNKKEASKVAAEETAVDKAVSLVDDMINEVHKNPHGTATPLSGLYRGAASLKGIVDPTGEPSTSIAFTQKRDLLIATAEGLKRDGRMSNQDRQRLENAIGSVSVSTPANAIQSLTTLKNVMNDIKKAKQLARSGAGTQRPAFDGESYKKRRMEYLGY